MDNRIENFIKVLTDGYYSNDIHNDVNLIADLIKDKKLGAHLKLVNSPGFYYGYSLIIREQFEVQSNSEKKLFKTNDSFKISDITVRGLEERRLIQSREEYGSVHVYHYGNYSID